MTFPRILKVLAVVSFVLAIFAVPMSTPAMIALGLALSTAAETL